MPPAAEGEGVSRWQQRKAAKAMMYATSNEQEGGSILSRRRKTGDERYQPRGNEWQGRAWGLASTKVAGRKDPKTTRFSAGGSSRGGELYYGQKREFSTDLPPDDPVSYLGRQNDGKKKQSV